MEQQYNHDLCLKLHADIEHRLERGDQMMQAIWTVLRDGNGKPSHETRIDRIERAMERNNSLLWRFLTPALPLIYGVIAAGVVMYLQS
jgi:hypothetical protein